MVVPEGWSRDAKAQVEMKLLGSFSSRENEAQEADEPT